MAEPGPLGEELLCRARGWAAEVAATEAVDLVAPAEVPGAVRRAFAAGAGPVLVASTSAPRLSSAHARMALDDLEDGADATFGPGMDGAWYLVGLRQPHDVLLDLLGAPVAGEEVMGRLLAVSGRAHLEVGVLRMERVLRTPRDAAALRVDPLTPEPIRTALRRMG